MESLGCISSTRTSPQAGGGAVRAGPVQDGGAGEAGGRVVTDSVETELEGDAGGEAEPPPPDLPIQEEGGRGGAGDDSLRLVLSDSVDGSGGEEPAGGVRVDGQAEHAGGRAEGGRCPPVPASYFFQQEDREVPSNTSPAPTSPLPCERHDPTSLCLCNVCVTTHIPPQQQQFQSSHQSAPLTISNSVVPFPTSNHTDFGDLIILNTDINSNSILALRHNVINPSPVPGTSTDNLPHIVQNQNPGSSQPPPPPPPPPPSTPPTQQSQHDTQQLTPQPGELPTLQEAHRTHIPTLTHIPKASRGEWTKVLTDLYNRVSQSPETTTLWILLYILPRAILPAGRLPRQADAYSQARVVKERLGRWRRGEYKQLWDEAVSITKAPPKPRKKAPAREEHSLEEKNAQRATRLAQEGQYTRSLQSLTSAGMAQHNRTTVDIMTDKHPPAPLVPILQPESNTPQMTFSQTQVYNSIKSFRKGSAPGPSGLRAEHLKVATKSAPPNRTDKATSAITKLVNCMAGGKVPEEVAVYLCGARLHAANKKDGGIRPIAVGNILRRLTSKCFSYAMSDRAATTLAPHQLGVGVRGGCEALAHTVRQVVEDKPDQWVLQVDLINAFNLVDRATAFQEVEKHFPDCLSWVLSSYGVQAELLFGDTVIHSCVGFHQGDPLASLLFSLDLQPIVEQIQHEVPDLDINAWYLDDGTLVGKKDDLRRAVDIIIEQGPARGLYLSTATTAPLPKSTIWNPANTSTDNDDPLDRGIPRIQQAGIILLGTPVGSHHFIQERIRDKIERVRNITSQLPLLQDAQTEFVLLRSCLSLPKVMYVLRTTDPTHHQALWQEFDSITREALTRILGSPVDGLQWAQAQLPVSMGGLGLRAAEDHAPAAFATSLLSSQSIRQDLLHTTEEDSSITIPPALLALLTTKKGEEATTESLQGVSQKAASLEIDLHNHHLLTDHYTREGVQRDIARLASLGLPHAGDWLNVMPSPALGLHIRSTEFSVSVRYRLGCKVFRSAGQCPACPRHSDQEGDHAISCGSEGERIARHNHLRDALYHTAVSAALAPTKEGRALLPGTDARPADVLISNWTGGKDTALDVTVVNPLQAAMVAQAATTPGHALTCAYKRKMQGTAAACRREGMVFIPLPVETLGGWHDQAVQQVKKLGAALSRQTGQEESEAIRHLFQRLSVLLVKGNAALFLNRIPSFPATVIDGVE